MDLEQFRREAHAMVDWMADYLRDVETRPIVPATTPGQVRAALPAAPPEAAEPFERIRADVDTIIMPGLTHWAHPAFKSCDLHGRMGSCARTLFAHVRGARARIQSRKVFVQRARRTL